jgi:hypothetical protein
MRADLLTLARIAVNATRESLWNTSRKRRGIRWSAFDYLDMASMSCVLWKRVGITAPFLVMLLSFP